MTTRERLVSTTSNLVRKKGYYGTGINEILKSVAVPKGSLYHHFPKGKDELIREAILYGGEIQMRKYGDALRGKPALEGLSAMVDVMAEELEKSDFQDACPIAAVAMAAGIIEEEIRVACDKVFKGWQNDLAGYLERRGVTNALEKAEELYAMFEGAYVLSKAHKDVKYLLLQKKYIALILNA
ncbi:TetR/AcrR family transcriptional regulator [Roseivirga pacifica]